MIVSKIISVVLGAIVAIAKLSGNYKFALLKERKMYLNMIKNSQVLPIK